MPILSRSEIRELYDRRAGVYDRMMLGFRVLGVQRWRRDLVAALRAPEGGTVVDLCCGGGQNFRLLETAVGASGRIVGVDLSERMLARARKRIASEGWSNVELARADVEEFDLPSGCCAVLSTFGLEMSPRHDGVIEKIARALPADGRLGLLGLKHPERWPGWLTDAGVLLMKPFGVRKEYETFRPWLSARAHMRVLDHRELLLGAAYSCVAEPKAARIGVPAPASRRPEQKPNKQSSTC